MLKKHSITIKGHSTSFSLEPEFFEQLKRIAGREETSLAKLITKIDTERDLQTNLSSALRVFVLNTLLDSEHPN